MASMLTVLATGRLPDWLTQGLERHDIDWEALQWPKVHYTASPLEVQHRLTELASRYDTLYWVFTSPQASRFAAELLFRHEIPRPAGVYSVGRGSGTPLLDLGYAVVWPEQEANSTALAELITRHALVQREGEHCYVHWCAPSRRPELHTRMTELSHHLSGFRFEELYVYQTEYPTTFAPPAVLSTDVLIQSPGALKVLVPWMMAHPHIRIWCLGPATATEIDRALPDRSYHQCLNLDDWFQRLSRLTGAC